MKVWILELGDRELSTYMIWGLYTSEKLGLDGAQEYIAENTNGTDCSVETFFVKIKEYTGVEHQWREIHKYHNLSNEKIGWETNPYGFLSLRCVEVHEDSSNGPPSQ